MWSAHLACCLKRHGQMKTIMLDSLDGVALNSRRHCRSASCADDYAQSCKGSTWHNIVAWTSFVSISKLCNMLTRSQLSLTWAWSAHPPRPDPSGMTTQGRETMHRRIIDLDECTKGAGACDKGHKARKQLSSIPVWEKKSIMLFPETHDCHGCWHIS